MLKKKAHGVSGVFAADAVEFSAGSSLELEVAEGLLEVETSVTATADEEQEEVDGRFGVVTEGRTTPAVCVKSGSNRR